MVSTSSGVYIFKDNLGEIIYVGKAKNLKKRVSSYFRSHNSPKTQVLAKSIDKVETIVVDNEVEALLLENTLIKKHKPKYNINLKDSKTYAYIKITDEKYPKILFARKVSGKGSYFGPFPFGVFRRRLFDVCRKLYGIMTPRSFSSGVNFEIGLVPARREGDVDLKKYKENVERAKQFLSGKNLPCLKKELEREMKFYSQNLEFEKANSCKKLLFELEDLFEEQRVVTSKNFNQDVVVFKRFGGAVHIFILSVIRGVVQDTKSYDFDYEVGIVFEFVKRYYGTHLIPNEILTNLRFWRGEGELEMLLNYFKNLSGRSVVLKIPKRGEKKRLVELALKNIDGTNLLEEIQELVGLPKVPNIIECFDVSNLGREFVVGAMTRWEVGVESERRNFEIKSFTNKQDDFGAMREIVGRRILFLKKSQNFPDLIIIDGGHSHLKVVLGVLKLLNVKIPIVGLAKKNEEIFVPDNVKPLVFNKMSREMLFLRKIRDSTHNLAVRYNRKKREMKIKKGL